MKGQKSCFYCKHGKLIKGHMGSYYDPPEPDMIDCQNENVDWDSLDQNDIDIHEDTLPNICGYYDPHIVGKCGNNDCSKIMNILLHDVEFRFDGEIPVCSKECRDTLDKQFLEDWEAEWKNRA